MNQPLEIRLRTLTPLWTGGVDGTSNRLHATGIIGSLRWWYEAIVRGLGGYVSDPAAEESAARSEFNTQAYEEAKRAGATEREALQAGLKSLCAVSYLFGATGWARLFQLQVVGVQTTPLHFRTSLVMNGSWLRRVFGGEAQNIDALRVPFGDIHLRLLPRGYDADYAMGQIALTLRMAADYGGLGARLQHGFGQVEPELPDPLRTASFADGMQALTARLGTWEHKGQQSKTPFDLRNFVSLTYDIPVSALSDFTRSKAHVGSSQKNMEAVYLPCTLDLRYKGRGSWGMRRWLKEQKGWRESDDPMKLEPLDELMGPRSQWGRRGKERFIDDDLRTASRVFFGMPYQVDSHSYRLRIFGFAPPRLLAPEELSNLCQAYMDHAVGIRPLSTTFGKDLIARSQGASL
jgi:CRISPR-associated protein Cmr1